MPYKRRFLREQKRKTPPTIVGGLYIKQRFIMAKSSSIRRLARVADCARLPVPKILAISAHSNNKGYYYVEVTDKENARVVRRARSLVPTSL